MRLRGGRAAPPPGCADPLIHVFPALPAVVPALPLVAGAETTETSPPTTTIRWKRQTLLENVRCEERHKAAGAPTWHVRRPGTPPQKKLPPPLRSMCVSCPVLGDAPVLESPKNPRAMGAFGGVI